MGNLFDTSIIGTDDITSAIFSWQSTANGVDNSGNSYDVETVTCNPASDAAWATTDWNSFTFTAVSAPLAVTDVTANTFEDFTLTDLSVVNKTGITKLGIMLSPDLDDVAPPNSPQNLVHISSVKSADNGSDIPKLVITHSSAENTHSIDLVASSSQYLSRADEAVLDITGDMSLEAWVKIDSFPSSPNTMAMVAKRRYDISGRSYSFVIRNTGGQIELGFDPSDDGTGKVYSVVDWNASLDTWYHVAMVYDDDGGEGGTSGSVTFYVDGSQQGSIQSGLDTSMISSTADLLIGAGSSNAPDAFWDGKIDEVRMWDDIRTEAEINDNKALQLVGDEANLVGYWQLNNGLGDTGGNALTLTNNNSAVFSTDIPTWAVAYTSTVADGLSLGDVLAKTYGTYITQADSVSLSDSIPYTTSFLKTISDSVSLSDSSSFISTFTRTISEALSLSDTISAAIVIPISVTESISLSDTKALVTSFTKTISDTFSLSDAVTTIKGLSATISESVSLSDSATMISIIAITVSESITLVDSIIKGGWSWINKATDTTWNFINKNTP
jgi:hypothetical protein